MREGNKEPTVKVNLWALDKYKEDFDAEMARLWIKGHATHADTGEVQKFNDAGGLVKILGRRNARKLKSLKVGMRWNATPHDIPRERIPCACPVRRNDPFPKQAVQVSLSSSILGLQGRHRRLVRLALRTRPRRLDAARHAS